MWCQTDFFFLIEHTNKLDWDKKQEIETIFCNRIVEAIGSKYHWRSFFFFFFFFLTLEKTKSKVWKRRRKLKEIYENVDISPKQLII